jgi:LuxR family maltose regulon positive regulatory protein
MATLLRQLVEKKQSSRLNRGSVSGEYINRILGMFPGETGNAHAQNKPQPQLIDLLTPREMDVLRLLGEGLSNREIAGRLYLSPNTLRVYTTNLYAKLDVHNRTQAVTHARDLGII